MQGLSNLDISHTPAESAPVGGATPKVTCADGVKEEPPEQSQSAERTDLQPQVSRKSELC